MIILKRAGVAARGGSAGRSELASLSRASFSLLSSNSLCLAYKISLDSFVDFNSVSACFSFVLTMPNSSNVCSCWKASEDTMGFDLDFLPALGLGRVVNMVGTVVVRMGIDEARVGIVGIRVGMVGFKVGKVGVMMGIVGGTVGLVRGNVGLNGGTLMFRGKLGR